ncbi:hypothetical protein TTE1084 [Caldanaerobacter subterraneus subsp. tengcongensis MB4]|uniref:Uncharacterized protein n=1 Tax=Caldanaerobacter subterraneus subsp. tengcongensis (strain DSM 15242 / JCM 11007 / NBRC 100824 / MB4) TaxID=273068 RepID=Q8RAV7_CALS4|nr:hypothetical protein TTE1084 [Caldanaerobacter subterraneus subsp. tengcongensis MB4]
MNKNYIYGCLERINMKNKAQQRLKSSCIYVYHILSIGALNIWGCFYENRIKRYFEENGDYFRNLG